MRAEHASVLIVGIGSELLADEGLGVHVARLLLASPRKLPAGVDVAEAGTALFDFLPEMSCYHRVVVVDAIRLGREPGSIYRVEIDSELEERIEPAPPLSLHQSGLFEALAAARLLNLLPGRLTLIGAEPERLEPGLELSATLRCAADKIISLLITEVSDGETPAADPARPLSSSGS